MKQTKDNRSKDWQEMSDAAIIRNIGEFVKQSRLYQNITQAQVALDAGISRSTLSLLERGETVSIATLIQVLRALEILHLLSIFEPQAQISPIAVAKAEIKKRKRARNNKTGTVSDVDFEPW